MFNEFNYNCYYTIINLEKNRRNFNFFRAIKKEDVNIAFLIDVAFPWFYFPNINWSCVSKMWEVVCNSHRLTNDKFLNSFDIKIIEKLKENE